MESLLVVMQIIALACVSILSVYLIVTIVRIKDILNQIEHSIKEISSKAIPVFENLEVITTRVKNVTSQMEEQFEMVGQTISSIKGIADNVVDFQERLQAKIQQPIYEALDILSAMVRGIRGIVDRVRS
ncbi:MAG: DUF948 domain-containing protein [Bacteroidetes bacterium]|nr:MAG: DUF948 domain-containing protein [Bacteroidota bacterium]